MADGTTAGAEASTLGLREDRLRSDGCRLNGTMYRSGLLVIALVLACSTRVQAPSPAPTAELAVRGASCMGGPLPLPGTVPS